MRVTGKESFDSDDLESTIGAVRKSGPMDRLLDFFGGLFSGRDARQNRRESHKAQLIAASKANPVVAQRPVAPMKQSKDAKSSEMKMTTMSDDGGHETVVNTEGLVVAQGSSPNGANSEAEKVYAWDEEMSVNQSSEESIESMAMLGGSQTTTSPQSTTVTGKQCGSCGVAVSDSDRFCDGCGASI